MKASEWKTKSGQVLKIKDMTDSHLLNTIRFLERAGEKQMQQEIAAAWSCLSSLQGEMATFYCEQDIDRLEETTLEDWLNMTNPKYNRLVAEAEKRKLL